MIRILETIVIPQMSNDGTMYDQEFVTIGFFRDGQQYAQVRAYPEDAEGLLEGEPAKLVNI
jgi:hypothetical protein